MTIEQSKTPKAQESTWTLTAPDGRTWQADSPLKACGMENRERVPANVALARIMEAASEPTSEEIRLQVDLTACQAANRALSEKLRLHSKAVMEMTAALCMLPDDVTGRIERDRVMELVTTWRLRWDAANREAALAPLAGGWVSVKDRLPPDCGDYLIHSELSDGNTRICTSSLNPAMTGFYVEYDQSGELPIEEVTHWMPLPAAPALRTEKE